MAVVGKSVKFTSEINNHQRLQQPEAQVKCEYVCYTCSCAYKHLLPVPQELDGKLVPIAAGRGACRPRVNPKVHPLTNRTATTQLYVGPGDPISPSSHVPTHPINLAA
ncbi:unnamed protein product, partial [Iphiclides podalirius]